MRISWFLKHGILIIALLLLHVNAEDPTSLVGAPPCATNCLARLPDQSLANNSQLCQDNTFSLQLDDCVKRDCSVIEILSLTNATKTLCGAPVSHRGYEIQVTTLVMTALALVFFILRIISKCLHFLPWGMDDYAMIVAFVFVILSTITIQFMVVHGLGQDIWTLNEQQITTFFQLLLVNELTYVMALTLIKVSILLFFLTIFPDPMFRTIVKGTLIFIGLMFVAFSILGVLQRQPIWLLWEGWKDKIPRGKSLSTLAISLPHAALNVALDVWMLLLPLSQLYHLGLKLRKKIGIAAMFSVGIFAIRIRSSLIFATATDITGMNYLPLLPRHSPSYSANHPPWSAGACGVTIWSCIEICVGVLVGCMPHARQAMRAARSWMNPNRTVTPGSSAGGIFVDRSLATITATWDNDTFIQAPARVESLTLYDKGNLLGRAATISHEGQNSTPSRIPEVETREVRMPDFQQTSRDVITSNQGRSGDTFAQEEVELSRGNRNKK
ncbi:CFEM domain-containing [Fusarium albosuccineum]|uniref:CFEM domain-containing n=1 Tax=Fusarium albosuccineum TaxID=1237068 RepID=A0A8H4LFB0_9HYPO|nr:CFEM domain-containing [Fusarium albosuccineum]